VTYGDRPLNKNRDLVHTLVNCLVKVANDERFTSGKVKRLPFFLRKLFEEQGVPFENECMKAVFPNETDDGLSEIGMREVCNLGRPSGPLQHFRETIFPLIIVGEWDFRLNSDEVEAILKVLELKIDADGKIIDLKTNEPLKSRNEKLKERNDDSENKLKQKEYQQKPEIKAKQKEREQTTKYKAKRKEYRTKTETKAKSKEYREKPEYKAKRKKYEQKPETKAKRKKYEQKPETKAKRKKYRQTPEYKAKQNARRQKPENKAKSKEYREKPEYKARRKAYEQKPETKARRKAYEQKPETKARRRKAYDAQKRDRRPVHGTTCPLCDTPGSSYWASLPVLAQRLAEMGKNSKFPKMVVDHVVTVWCTAEQKLSAEMFTTNSPEEQRDLCGTCHDSTVKSFAKVFGIKRFRVRVSGEQLSARRSSARNK